MKDGIVYIVGAGPGDPKLITVYGLECIQKADIIAYDRLVNPALLDFAKKDAELVYFGKVSFLPPNKPVLLLISTHLNTYYFFSTSKIPIAYNVIYSVL